MFRVFLQELISKSSSKSEAEIVGNVGRFDDSVEVFELTRFVADKTDAETSRFSTTALTVVAL